MSGNCSHHSPGGGIGGTASTVLKWCGNGELSALDLERIVQRLQQVDPVAEALDPSHFAAIQSQQAS
jgi:hypothetical protein